MAPETRSQAAREAVAVSNSAPEYAITEQDQRQGVRLRQNASDQFTSNNYAASTRSRKSDRSNTPDEPPRFTINLSLPPEQRYLEVCAAFKDEMLNLTSLFDEVVGGMVAMISIVWLRRMCKLCLRKIYNKEENAELIGISKASGVDMYLLVCFNVLLDLFMGCSSGGAVVRAGENMESGSKMVHFRTLDWGMPALRRIIVQLDFVAEKDGPMIASSITYAGFVGVLTGVRKELSISLNFRPNRIDNGNFWADVKYVLHLLMVLFGRRPSIASTLRQFFLPHREKRKWTSWLPWSKDGDAVTLSYLDIIKRVGGEKGVSRPITTTACYLLLCNSEQTTMIEKDRISAVVRSSSNFMVVTNSDNTSQITTNGSGSRVNNPVPDSAIQEIVEEAQDRQQCASNNWANMRAAKAKRLGLHDVSSHDLNALSSIDEVIELVQKYPTTNECTHFACVLDPSSGKVAWCRRWIEPITAKWIRAHMSATW